MDLAGLAAWKPPPDWRRITIIDAHAGGEPFRVAIEGVPQVPGLTVLEKRRYAARHLDDLRRILMWEPRGHADMYGGWVGPPTTEGSHLSVLFLHNQGFSTMCGHGIIALTKVALETDLLPTREPETTIGIDTPAGQVVARATVSDGKVTRIRFRNVPSFALDLDSVVEVPGLGQVRYDLAYGGAFYAFVSASDVGLTCSPGDAAGLIQRGRAIKEAVSGSRRVDHPIDEELGFLYGVIFTGPPEDPKHHSRNVCVFADGEIDRSPTGTGVSARLAIHHARGEIGLGDSMAVESIVGSVFDGSIVDTVRVGPYPAIIPEVGGSAHITGRAHFWVDPDDDLGGGFLIR